MGGNSVKQFQLLYIPPGDQTRKFEGDNRLELIEGGADCAVFGDANLCFSYHYGLFGYNHGYPHGRVVVVVNCLSEPLDPLGPIAVVKKKRGD